MEIFDNVNLRSRRDANFDPWLQTILAKLVDLSTTDFVLRLEADHRAHTIHYNLVNSQNKTMAVISKRGETIRVETFRREQPDPEYHIKPGFSPVSAFVFKKDAEGFQDAAQALVDVLDAPTAYSERTVTKVRVHQCEHPPEPWAFTGGLITGVINNEDDQSWTVHLQGKRIVRMAKLAAPASYPKVLMYLVSDGRNSEIVNATEFHFYFELVSALEHA
jgi:hypothetical protein